MSIDAFGKQCPMPVVLAKKEIDKGNHDFAINVDNETAVKNLTRLGKKQGLAVSVDQIDGGWQVSLSQGGVNAANNTTVSLPNMQGSLSGLSGKGGCGYAVFIGKDFVGDGDKELGRSLMKMALYTLSESQNVPTSLLFMNAGVKLAAQAEPQLIENITTLIEKGTEVLICGACLDFYNIKDKVQVGEISNMYEILERMHEADKVITL
jgi:selenium metabolism protein YedF